MKVAIFIFAWIFLSFWFAISFGRFMAGNDKKARELIKKKWPDFDHYDW